MVLGGFSLRFMTPLPLSSWLGLQHQIWFSSCWPCLRSKQKAVGHYKGAVTAEVCVPLVHLQSRHAMLTVVRNTSVHIFPHTLLAAYESTSIIDKYSLSIIFSSLLYNIPYDIQDKLDKQYLECHQTKMGLCLHYWLLLMANHIRFSSHLKVDFMKFLLK